MALVLPRGGAAGEPGLDLPTASQVETQADRQDADARPRQRPLPSVYLGRTIAPPMHFSGAGWLTRASRQREEKPLQMLKALAIEPGQTVCDFGCGNGYHTLLLARKTGPRGQVYAADIQPEMLELLGERVEARGLQNIRPLLVNPDRPELPKRTFDLILMVDVYHEIADPPSVLAEVYEALAPSGRLALVEFREEDPDVPILPLHKMSQTQVVKELTANNMRLVGQANALPWQHLLIFARDDSPLTTEALEPWQPSESQLAIPPDPAPSAR